jgi:hypothetical protein
MAPSSGWQTSAIPPLSGHKRASGPKSTLMTLRRRLATPLDEAFGLTFSLPMIGRANEIIE